ncbi:MAG: aminoacyl-histidine dipeptidase [Bacteroidetes bacterium]|nr:aminoacyl-histidine dipeptidase [Bacteroidota bacterium]MBU1116283.1 aminoacyl-histidine dipeptidase [Bacteroidota bacterium]MBU1797131.1 aminoacyl-histidine dipeptidase [Bacteroidota bacterium]
MSKTAIEGLEPKLVWEYFYGMTQVPRPSKKEEKIRAHVREFANKNNFEFVEDKVGNIVIKVPATKGYENAPTIVIQGHLDMVCEKNKATNHDFDNDPLKIYRDGDWITAEGTTLGADNGIGVAAGMAVATDPSVIHGPLELLCTIDEETGMTGVNALQAGFITGRTLLNLDSEEDGAFYVGCSGGQDTRGYFELDYTDNNTKLSAFDIMVTGLKGGHSGLDVANGRANAIRLMAQLLNRIESKVEFELASISGGSLRNAIPREAEVTILINPSDEAKVIAICDKFVADTLLEFNVNDPGLKVMFSKNDSKIEKIFTKEFTVNLIKVLLATPHGIVAMSPDIPGLVETSTNLATLGIIDEMLVIGTSQRSAIDSAKWNISNVVKSVFELGNAAKVDTGDGYPGWQPNMDSQLLKISKEVYGELNNSEPKIKAIHAGLETGLLGAKYPGIDMISFGPTIEGAHSPDERLNIPATVKFYNLVKAILLRYTK